MFKVKSFTYIPSPTFLISSEEISSSLALKNNYNSYHNYLCLKLMWISKLCINLCHIISCAFIFPKIYDTCHTYLRQPNNKFFWCNLHSTSAHLVVSHAAVIRVVMQCFSPTNGCISPNLICFPLFKVHVKITECTNHTLPTVSSETKLVSISSIGCLSMTSVCRANSWPFLQDVDVLY